MQMVERYFEMTSTHWNLLHWFHADWLFLKY